MFVAALGRPISHPALETSAGISVNAHREALLSKYGRTISAKSGALKTPPLSSDSQAFFSLPLDLSLFIHLTAARCLPFQALPLLCFTTLIQLIETLLGRPNYWTAL